MHARQRSPAASRDGVERLHEITPVTKMARASIVIEQVLGVMYVAFLIARLANLYRNGAMRRP